MTPRIGIVCNFDLERKTYLGGPAYVRAVEAAGGLPVFLPYLGSPASVRELVAWVDGVILSGGSDLDPALFGEPSAPGAESIVPERDAFELALTRAVLDRDTPLLGICRGIQSLNVAVGGSLHVDLRSELAGAMEHRDGTPLAQLVHDVRVDPESQLARLCGVAALRVNSWHHQAVKAVGTGFRASAWAPDGVIEGIESTEHRFAVGVQWHPEHLWEADAAARGLFLAFVRACAAGVERAGPGGPR